VGNWRGVGIVTGDLDDEATLRRALAGAPDVFGREERGRGGVEREEAQGKRFATLAREAGVEHYVYTSVGSAHKRTGVPTLRQQMAHPGNRTPSPLPLACGPKTKLVPPSPRRLRLDDLRGAALLWRCRPCTVVHRSTLADFEWLSGPPANP
jgi:hypothetical protein